MQPTDEVVRNDFRRLINRSPRQVDNEIERGRLVYWNQQPKELRTADKRWPRKFIAIDAALFGLVDLFEEKGVKKSGLTIALPGMQLVLPAGVDRPDTLMMISIDRDGKRLGVGCGTVDELRDYELFVGKIYGVSWRLSVAPAVERLRERARNFKIELPDSFAPPASEPPMRLRGASPWQFRTKNRFTSKWEPTRRFVQLSM